MDGTPGEVTIQSVGEERIAVKPELAKDALGSLSPVKSACLPRSRGSSVRAVGGTGSG